jgi:hypothetical protein
MRSPAPKRSVCNPKPEPHSFDTSQLRMIPKARLPGPPIRVMRSFASSAIDIDRLAAIIRKILDQVEA